jgi:hypothetical protein
LNDFLSLFISFDENSILRMASNIAFPLTAVEKDASSRIAIYNIVRTESELIKTISALLDIERRSHTFVRFEVHTAVKMSILLFSVVTPCGLVGRY